MLKTIRKKKRVHLKLWERLLCLLLCLYVSGCADKVEFTRQAATQFFVQKFITEFVDILWMVEDRSPMSQARLHLSAEASRFFTKLDAAADDYRMAFVTTDIEFKPGLKPFGSPIILKQNFGTLSQRTTLFSNLISLLINLKTSGLNQGFESAVNVLGSAFPLRTGVPLVVVFISDSDDSKGVTNKKTVQHYADTLLALKGNNPNLLRVYSINYVPVAEADRNAQNRCATRFGADIDLPGFENRYFRLANVLGGETADLCGSFADQIDISGLPLDTLRKRFPLESTPDPSTIAVSVSRDGQIFTGFSFVYDSKTNEIIFERPPPEGTTIQINYLPVGS